MPLRSNDECVLDLNFSRHGGCSSGVERRIVDPEVAGSKPVTHPTQLDLTARPVKFWTVYSYLIVYDPTGSPITVIAVLHSARDV
jgi:hypothetical protein